MRLRGLLLCIMMLGVGGQGAVLAAETPDGGAPEQHAPPAPVLPPPTARSFPSAAAALEAVLATGPRVLALGEYHETIKGPKVPSSLKRVTEELLPVLGGQASDLVVETWITEDKCGQEEQAVVKDVAKTTARPQTTETEIVTLVRRAKEAGVKPHALDLRCDDYKTIYTAQGVDYDQMLKVLTRELRGRVQAVLKRRDAEPAGARRLVLVYGGALHNDLYPQPELSNYTFGPPLRQQIGAGYVELDVFVPEYIEQNAKMKREPWFQLAKRSQRPGQTLLIERGPGSFILLFPRTKR